MNVLTQLLLASYRSNNGSDNESKTGLNFFLLPSFFLGVILSGTMSSAQQPQQSGGATRSGAKYDQELDVEKGENVLLKCRFNPALSKKTFTLTWGRTSQDGKHKSVAIGGVILNKQYRYKIVLLID